MCSHEIDEITLDFDYLLAGIRPGHLDVTRQGESAGSEMYGGDRFAGHPELVDYMADALDVLEEQLAGVVQVDVRLRRSIDDEREAARHPPVGFDDRTVAAQFENGGWAFCHP